MTPARNVCPGLSVRDGARSGLAAGVCVWGKTRDRSTAGRQQGRPACELPADADRPADGEGEEVGLAQDRIDRDAAVGVVLDSALGQVLYLPVALVAEAEVELEWRAPGREPDAQAAARTPGEGDVVEVRRARDLVVADAADVLDGRGR